MPLSLDGTVAFTVDGPGGSTGGTLVGDGPVLRVAADDPVVAWDALVGAAPRGPRALAELADALHSGGMTVEVSGPRGRLATVGAGADSALGGLVTGSRRVSPGSPAALRPLALAQLRRTARTRRGVLVVLAAVAVVLLRRRLRA